MLKSILILIFLSFCIGTGVWLFFMAAVKRGDFDDIEGAKYRMLDDDEEGPEDCAKSNNQKFPQDD
jgi:cbb3-type cytochrome oxidase maturation protein